jgi:hypothetical protein
MYQIFPGHTSYTEGDDELIAEHISERTTGCIRFRQPGLNTIQASQKATVN